MSKDDSQLGGLFSRVVRFVRPSTVNGSELDALADESPDTLRQMLERKRRNDAVRQNEFDRLRKLRQQLPAGAGEALTESADLASGFQASSSPVDRRAATLQKIDRIEEQMSQQWWRNKQPADASTLPMELMPAAPTPDSVHVAADAAPDAPAGPASQPLDFALTLPVWSAATVLSSVPAWQTPALQAEATTVFVATLLCDPPVGDASLQTAAQPTAPGFVHDTGLEEAAIAFANGDVTGAEASLLELLEQRAAEPELQQPVWLALFDLYRAAGLADRFELLAIDFAGRVGRSAPLWFSLPAQLGLPAGATATLVESDNSVWRWSAPAVLTQQSVAALRAAKKRAPAPWSVGWTALERIEEDAVPLLECVISEWAQTPGQIQFLDAQQLLQQLQLLSLCGKREASSDGWLLHMAVLRLMEQQDSFERVALDYCITYEVSPPSWTAPESSYVDNLTVEPPVAAAPGGELLGTGLAGCIDGDAGVWLAALEAQARPGVLLTVDCSLLIRLDFAAAGSVLNWAAQMQSQGHQLRFEQLHQLLAVFFAMIGTNEHAQLLPRRD